MAMGSYRDRMKLAPLAHWMGYGGGVGLAVLRLFMWGIMLVGTNFDRYDLITIYKQLDVGMFITQPKDIPLDMRHLLFSSNMLVFATLIYIPLSIMTIFAPRFYMDEIFSHP
eukprot:157122_1